MEMTPPTSPKGLNDDSRNTISEKGSCGFHCVGEPLKKNPFDPRGFLLSGDGVALSGSFNTSLKNSDVTLFQQDYDLDNTNQDDLFRLFRISWNRLSIIISAQKVGTYGHTTNHGNLSTTVDFDGIRQELREFYTMLRVFISSQGDDDDTSWTLEETLPTFIKGLSLLRGQLGWLTELPSYVLATQLKKSPSFHLFHCHLELRWLHISVLSTLASCMSSVSRVGTQTGAILQTCSSESNIQHLLQSAIKLCIVDLIEIAVFKFNKLNQDLIVHTSLFNCMCVKELWLLLRLITENLNDNNPKSFWIIVDEALELVVKADAEMPKKAWRHGMTLPNQILCSEPGLFALWLLRDIGELFMYMPDGTISAVGPELDSGQGTVKRVMTNMAGSHGTDEAQRRTLISLISSFITNPWKTSPEPLKMLWEGFSRKLDCAFQLPGSVASSYAIASETIDDILASVDFRKQKRNLNSFEMFLALLANYLKLDNSQWKVKMSGRFYSKLSEKKVDGLSEMGLYHLTQLFLTIGAQTDAEEVGLRFQKLVRFSETDEKRNEMIMKSMLSFLHLFVVKGKPLSPLADPVTSMVDSFIVKNQNQKVVQVFIDNLQCLIKKIVVLPPDLYVFFGVWIKSFLSQNHRRDSSSLRNLFSLMLDVLQKIQLYMDNNNIVGGGVEKLVCRLNENLLPFLKDPKCNDSDLIADLAIHFTLISLEFNSSFTKDSFQSLVRHFMMSDNLILVRRYLQRISSSTKLSNIIDGNESLQVLLFQGWVRCCTLSSIIDQERDKEIAQRVIAMPLLKNEFKLAHETFSKISDPLIYLIETVGLDSFTTSKKTFHMLIEPLKNLIPVIKSSLFPPKLKDTSWVQDKGFGLEKDVVVRAYSVLGKLTSDCSALIFEKNTSSNFLITLVNNLILNPTVYNMDVRLPVSMDDGLRKSIFLFLKGLIKLDPKKEKVLQRFINDIIRVYVPRFGVIPSNDPFNKIWDHPENMETATYIITSVCEIFLMVDRNNMPCRYYSQGLNLINEIISRNEFDDILMGIIIDNVLPSCLYVVGKLTDVTQTYRRQETQKTFGLIFQSEAWQTNPHLWDQTNDVLNALSNKHLGFSPQLYMRMMIFLVKDFKHIVKRFLPTLEVNIKDVISKRGSGSDKSLESFLEMLKAELTKT